MAKTYTDKKGYKRFANSGIPVHRYVARRKIGGRIFGRYVVHHRDGNKLNNARKNLQVMPRKKHSKLHSKLRNLFGW